MRATTDGTSHALFSNSRDRIAGVVENLFSYIVLCHDGKTQIQIERLYSCRLTTKVLKSSEHSCTTDGGSALGANLTPMQAQPFVSTIKEGNHIPVLAACASLSIDPDV
jgi:hypothetical protein